MTNYFLVLAFAGVALGADAKDITIPVGTYGNIIIKHTKFIQFVGDVYLPQITFYVQNDTTSTWNLSVLFEIGGFCNDEPHQWSFPVTFRSIVGKSSSDWQMNDFNDIYVSSQAGQVTRCTAEIIHASLFRATRFGFAPGTNHELPKLEVYGAPVDTIDLTQELVGLKTERIVAKAAYDAIIDQGRLAETKEKAVRLARDMEQCHNIYLSTIDKKTTDLTVRETQNITACRYRNLYK